VTVLALGGCAAAPDLADDDAAAFRARVAAVADRSLAGDFAGATAELALLETAVAEASDAGSLGDSREAQITEAIALVRADLDTQIQAQLQAQQEAEQAAREAEAAAQQAAAAEAARIAAEQAAAAENDADRGNAGPGNDGPGNGNKDNNGKGKGKPGNDEDDE
jgi:hypothetical protein